MVKKRFRCLNRGHKFEAEVFERGETVAKQQPSGPVRCPRCNRTDSAEEA